MKKAIFCGSFDPFTLGHLNILQRATKLFDVVYVAILDSKEKKYMFSKMNRLTMVGNICSKFDNVEIATSSGFFVDLCKELGVYNVIRGVRNNIDFSYEQDYYFANKSVENKLEFVFLPTEQNLSHISSSLARQMIEGNYPDLTSVLPTEIIKFIKDKKESDYLKKY